jgi:voltage-gated potassium channel
MTAGRHRLFTADHIYRDLVIGLLAVFGIVPILNHLFRSNKVDTYLITAFLVFALFEITRRRSDLFIGLAFGLPAVASGLVNAATPDSPLLNVGPVVMSGVFLAYLIVTILSDVFSGRRVSSEQIFGAVAAYLLIGLLFAIIYGFIALVDPHAFTYNEAIASYLGSAEAERGLGVSAYFSFVTMTTLGYGDITPVSSAARGFAWFQAVLGQLYIAITIAALVANHIAKKSA